MTAIFNLLMMAILNGITQGILDDINAATVQVLNLVTNNRSKVNLASLEGSEAQG
jgi:biopolymer transport protein ExbB